MTLTQQQKDFLLGYILAVIPELPTDLHKIILEVRMRIMNNGGRDIDEVETKQVLERMQEHKLLVIEDDKIMRKVRLNTCFNSPMVVEFMKAQLFNTAEPITFDPSNLRGFTRTL